MQAKAGSVLHPVRWYPVRFSVLAILLTGALVLVAFSSDALLGTVSRAQSISLSLTYVKKASASTESTDLSLQGVSHAPRTRARRRRGVNGELFTVREGPESGAEDLPWVDEPVKDEGVDAYRCSGGVVRRERVCVYGPGSREATQMQPTFFYIDLLTSTDSCYARVTGPSIFVVKTTAAGQYRIRGDYTAHEAGVHQLWISCIHSRSNTTIQTLPHNSLVVPFFHQQLVDGSPFPLTIAPNPRVKPRCCQPCMGPDLGTLSGQWIRRESVVEQCGQEALGAIEEWHTDSHVWIPRECSLPFFSRELFLDVFDGADFLFVGDSSVRGTFCDLQNWLYFDIRPSFYEEPYIQKEQSSSNWDGRACGYNTIQPTHLSFIHVPPNPFQVANVSFRYFEAREAEMYPIVVDNVWRQVEVNRTDRSYCAVIANYGLWWWKQFKPHCGPAALSRLLIDHLRCRRAEPLPIPTDSALHPNDCTWQEALQGLSEDTGDDTCLKEFPGRIVYRSTTGKFDVHNICMGGHNNPWETGEICAQNSATWDMLLTSYGTERSWDENPLLLDVFDMVYARPDRSLDSFHFFHHKCMGRQCSRLTYDYERCCYIGTMFPFSGSLSMTNLLIHQLAYDPLLYRKR